MTNSNIKEDDNQIKFWQIVHAILFYFSSNATSNKKSNTKLKKMSQVVRHINRKSTSTAVEYCLIYTLPSIVSKKLLEK